jgi:hypothetical protein
MVIKPPVKTKSSPLESLFRLLNPLISLLLRSPLHGLMSQTCFLLSFKGRKSGITYTFPVGYYGHKENTLTVIPLHPWWKNLQGHVPVTIWFKGQKYTGVAEAFQGDETTIKELQRLIEASSTLMRVLRIERNEQGLADSKRSHEIARTLALVRVQMMSSL